MTYAEQLAEAEAYRAKERAKEASRRELAAQWLHTLYSCHKKDGVDGPLLIMNAVAS